MKIKVESERIVKAVKKLDGIEVVLENLDDAREAINLILEKAELIRKDDHRKLKEVEVTSFRSYETSSVEYKMIFLLNFLFEDDTPFETKVSIIKGVQEFFNRV